MSKRRYPVLRAKAWQAVVFVPSAKTTLAFVLTPRPSSARPTENMELSTLFPNPLKVVDSLDYVGLFYSSFIILNVDARAAFQECSITRFAFVYSVLDHDAPSREHRFDDARDRFAFVS